MRNSTFRSAWFSVVNKAFRYTGLFGLFFVKTYYIKLNVSILNFEVDVDLVLELACYSLVF